ncbi:hypothetical protein [Francisella philomiragia]|uniref:hypothetical protein n=1 Tax=Francisella philomiragia TaxID=28110 RepID=UPI001904390B|nr:hypothetical protein [Francisella philomiragia]MBK2297299.1 virulence factor [Francisella philomiragia]
MYAITFNLSTDSLNQPNRHYKYADIYQQIKDFLENSGFICYQGNTFFGDSTINAVTCVVTVQKMSIKYPWLGGYIEDIRMLRVESNDDLMPAIKVYEDDCKKNQSWDDVFDSLEFSDDFFEDSQWKLWIENKKHSK